MRGFHGGSLLFLLGISAAQEIVIDAPTDARNLPEDCRSILFYAGMTNEFKASPNATDFYQVAFKTPRTERDVTDVLTMPVMRGVTPTLRFDKDYDRGFVARLNYQQACALEQDYRIGQVHVCEDRLCEPHRDDRPLPAPGTPNVPNPPQTQGLNEECYKTIWYLLAGLNPSQIVPGEYIAVMKPYSGDCSKDASKYFTGLRGTIRNRPSELEGVWTGRWSYQTVCDVIKQPFVGFINAARPHPPRTRNPAAAGQRGSPSGARPPQGRGNGGFRH